MSRLDGAIQAVRSAIAAASEIPIDSIGPDEDIVDELSLDDLELISLALILEEVFSIPVPESLFARPQHRCPSSLAQWCIDRSNESEWREARQCGRRA